MSLFTPGKGQAKPKQQTSDCAVTGLPAGEFLSLKHRSYLCHTDPSNMTFSATAIEPQHRRCKWNEYGLILIKHTYLGQCLLC